ncbi:MAG: TRAP transporter small permease [Synergistes jonesii]|uniref:TRAP transporter small permease n=1 Tax=Synergistes jonesii TaxID=2754 RepID=UPI002A7555CA|nr:TRAP transporter small permease [Synergistes jonesii]MDY2984914.1 TRAP transporter small permease [Synergistes jonesii]
MKEVTFANRLMESGFWKVLLKIQGTIMFVTAAIMLAMLGAVVLARYAFHVDLYGYDEIILVDSFWMYFIGASYAMCKEEHIKADILASMMSKKMLAFTKIIAGVLQMAVNFVFIVLAYNMVSVSIETWTVSSLWNIPYFIPQISILLSFIVIGFYLTVFTIRDYNNFVSLKREGQTS